MDKIAEFYAKINVQFRFMMTSYNAAKCLAVLLSKCEHRW